MVVALGFIAIIGSEEAQSAIAPHPTPQQVVAMLSEMLTQEDWQAIAKTASESITSRILSASQA